MCACLCFVGLVHYTSFLLLLSFICHSYYCLLLRHILVSSSLSFFISLTVALKQTGFLPSCDWKPPWPLHRCCTLTLSRMKVTAQHFTSAHMDCAFHSCSPGRCTIERRLEGAECNWTREQVSREVPPSQPTREFTALLNTHRAQVILQAPWGPLHTYFQCHFTSTDINHIGFYEVRTLTCGGLGVIWRTDSTCKSKVGVNIDKKKSNARVETY